MIDQPQSVSSGSQVFMMSIPINVATRSKDYQTPSLADRKEKEVTPSSSTLSSGPLQIERPNPDSTMRPPSRGVVRKSSYNPQRLSHLLALLYNEDFLWSETGLVCSVLLKRIQGCPKSLQNPFKDHSKSKSSQEESP